MRGRQPGGTVPERAAVESAVGAAGCQRIYAPEGQGRRERSQPARAGDRLMCRRNRRDRSAPRGIQHSAALATFASRGRNPN